MSSFFDAIFERASIPLNQVHGDQVRVKYTPKGGVEIQVEAIIRDVQVHESTLEAAGKKITQCQLLIRRDSAGPFGGIAGTVLDGTFEFYGSKWKQVVVENESINNVSNTFAVFTVRKVGITGIGHPGRIKEPT